MGEFSSKLTRILRPFGFRPAFYNLTTVKGLFVRLKDPIPRRERSGLYRLTCGDCNSVYIGETSRQLKIRVEEHLKPLEKGKLGESAFADHLISNGHSFREDSVTLLQRKKFLLLTHCIGKYLNSDDVTVLNRYIPDEDFIDLIYETESPSEG